MSLVRNPRTGNWEADIRFPKGTGRLHVSLRTKKKSEAQLPYAALKKLVDEQQTELVDLVRRRIVTVPAVVAAYRENRPFNSLLLRESWPTLEKAIAEYLKWQESQGDRSKGTLNALKFTLAQAARFFGMDRRLDSIRHTDVEAWKVSLTTRQEPEKPVQATTVRDYLLRLSGLFNWHLKREHKRNGSARKAFTNPVEREIVPAVVIGARKRFLSAEEAQRLFAATPTQLKFAVAAALHAGLRLDEVCHLRPPPQDMDLEMKGGGILYVHAKGDWRPKSKKPREVPMTQELVSIARSHVAEFASEAWMLPAFSSMDDPMPRKTLGVHFKRIVQDAGLITDRTHPMGVTFHTLRHTFGSQLVMAGVDLFTVARLMGHADTKMIELVYGHLSPDHKRLAIGRLAGAIRLLPKEG